MGQLCSADLAAVGVLYLKICKGYSGLIFMNGEEV
jgi:hypothetical protein